MKIINRNKIAKATLVLSAGIFGINCNPQQNSNPAPNSNANAANSNVSTTLNANSNKPSPPVKTGQRQNISVTLPVLDAMFYDESFAAELKSKLQLNDEEIDKLKKVSNEAVANLDEDAEPNSRSTRAANKRAEENIRAILGNEKSDNFFELVKNRWASGDFDAETALPSKPNSVPNDTRIVVNAPAYRMDVFKDGKLIKTYKIGIGYPEFPLPNSLRKAESIIFNPTWTPPDEPWVKGKVQPGKTVKAGSSQNPLGPIKIPIGLPSLIHGGKNVAKLGTFASHGCVGLTNAQVQDFSLLLAQISNTELTAEDVTNFAKEKETTKNITLGSQVPIELRYETIVIEDGKLSIYRDVYEKGTNTEENLRKVFDNFGVSFDKFNEPMRLNIIKALNEMNKDAQGNSISADEDEKSDTTDEKSKDEKENSKNKAGKVTNNIKGKKEIVFELAELKGKGYPLPVNTDAGKQ